jgi:methylmalonyl-CoA/ethylmalonyl-CoA epimerase
MPSAHSAVLDHVAVAVEKVAAVPPFLVGVLGARPDSGGPGPGYRFWQWRFARGGRLEVLEPDGPPGGFLHRFLASRGPGVHHVTFKVASIEVAMARAEAAGYAIVGASLEQPAWKEAFLHPKQAQGVVVQLAESHPELEPPEWEQGRWPFPQLPEAAAAPVDLLGLRLVARSAGSARRQWQDTLLGTCADAEGGLLFHWPDSPLRIAVDIEPDAAEEGPVAIELAPRADLALTDAPHPVLGARFRARPWPDSRDA